MIRVNFEGGAMNFIDLPLEYGTRRLQIVADALPSGNVGGRTIDMPDSRSAGDGYVYII